jgi:hypothetical protein
MARIATTPAPRRACAPRGRWRGHARSRCTRSRTQVDRRARERPPLVLPAARADHHADLVDEFVDTCWPTAPALVKNRVSYGQSSGDGKARRLLRHQPQESTQGALARRGQGAQKRDNVQICRISVPEHADVPALLAAMAPFFARKYDPAAAST